jgi:hypothetical protein
MAGWGWGASLDWDVAIVSAVASEFITRRVSAGVVNSATPYPWPHGHRLTQIVSRDA